MIPELDDHGLLPPGRHPATWDEIRDHFVKRAPFEVERELIFTAVELHFRMVSDIFSTGRLWLDGGFVTHKDWTAPKDADLAYLLNSADINSLSPDNSSRLLSLFTLQGVSSLQPQGFAARVQPMGGLVDAFVVLGDNLNMVQYWDSLWRTVKGPDEQIISNLQKGYLEVAW
jgi:hypothetical protein